MIVIVLTNNNTTTSDLFEVLDTSHRVNSSNDNSMTHKKLAIMIKENATARVFMNTLGNSIRSEK
ncbi:hypothetical protein SERLA73DRAFT_142009 [Serpula lacrymans var. lacrymans S7.3]|uniref:Uncharacterized protein n=1 Tax=Serpula lacrymans var. lacrymans (strain S7.3) TaxID=936435 RepID=F8Q748_SERL3|nr:hypothetical protein SERLA73DRAFT_142009 [Serpula lacrymans var. lacrymans S7.3]